MSSTSPRDACLRYLSNLGRASLFVDEPYSKACTAEWQVDEFVAAGRAFLTDLEQQLEQLGLQHRFYFGLIESSLDDQSTISSQDAYAIADIFAARDEIPPSFILFTLVFVRDIFLAWDALMSRRELFREVGNPDAEAPASSLIALRPQNPVRAAYARDQALLTLEFALLHEFYHVASAHLDALTTSEFGRRLHAVTSSDEQSLAGSSLNKVLELDADVMALRHLTMHALGGNLLMPHGQILQSSASERFQHIGRCTTLLFRLIELWRRHVRLTYTSQDLHPHPDVRDATLHAYLGLNADPGGIRSLEFAGAYERGQGDIIDALEAMNTLAPNFGFVEGLGQDIAIRETDWLVPELNRVRKDGVGPRDVRRLAAQARAASTT